MVRYRRNFLAGGTFFFTATLADRRSAALVENVDLLRGAFRTTRHERPFSVDAVVVLPDHLHIVMTLPPDDADFPGRWRRIKSLFTRAVVAHNRRYEPNRRGEYALWQRRFWEHTVRDEADLARHIRLHSLQSRQTRPRGAGQRLAALILSSVREAWSAAEGLGWDC
jgi:putative transposase